MKIIDILDNKIIISPEALCISPFSELWQNDKSKDKTKATSQIKYIWFYSDFNSPYFQHPEEDRHNLLLKDVIKDKDFKVDKDIKAGIIKYKQLCNSPAIEAIESAFILIGKINKYFKEVDLLQADPKKVMDMFNNMPKAIESLNQAKKTAMAEEVKGVKVRGNVDLGMYEE